MTNGCYRLHPIEWNIGEAAGALAAFCLGRAVRPGAVLDDAGLLRDFQRQLLEVGVPLYWYDDLPRGPCRLRGRSAAGPGGPVAGRRGPSALRARAAPGRGRGERHVEGGRPERRPRGSRDPGGSGTNRWRTGASTPRDRPMTNARIEAGALSASVSARGPHGWCGLDRLAHSDGAADWLVRPAITLEHYLGVPLDAPEHTEYEPFASQRSLRRVRESGCSLRYGPQDCCRVTCTIDYQVVAPHYVDTTVQVLTGRDRWPHGCLGLFFATIVEAPAYSGRHVPWLRFVP